MVGHIDLRVSAFSPDGARRATRHEVADARMSPGEGAEVGYGILTRLDVPPGRYMLRVGAVATVGGIRAAPGAPEVAVLRSAGYPPSTAGSAFVDVEVPNFATEPLSMTGIVLGTSPDITSGPKERLSSLLPVVPSTAELPLLQPGDRVRADLPGIAAALEPVAVSVEDRRWRRPNRIRVG